MRTTPRMCALTWVSMGTGSRRDRSSPVKSGATKVVLLAVRMATRCLSLRFRLGKVEILAREVYHVVEQLESTRVVTGDRKTTDCT